MSSFPPKTLTVNAETTYNYIHIKPTNEQTPYILFIHGFPSSSHDWHNQINFFSKKGYGIVAPDCLGYGKTSKPTDINAYNLKKLANETIQILDNEGIEKVIGVGHDWGSAILSRCANYHPTRFLRYAFIDVGYTPPGFSLSFDTVQHINAMVKTHVGFEIFGYFLFFDEKDPASLLNKNWESALSLFHTQDEDIAKNYMGATGGFRTWLTEGKVAPQATYITKEDKVIQQELFGPDSGGFAGPINYYRVALHGIGAEDDKAIPDKDHILQKPTLIITSDNFISKSADMADQMAKYAPDLTVKNISAGHWIMMEKPDETNAVLEEFFKQP